MNAEQALVIRQLLHRYLGEPDDHRKPYWGLAQRHRLLPIFSGWSGFVGLREDGALFWVAEDDDSAPSDPSALDAHLARIRGPELFPDLAFLAPVATPEWVECWSCHGPGRITSEGKTIGALRCQCGGLGKLPPDVAEALRTREG